MTSSTRKTIDNLGLDTSIRYAQDQQYLDASIIKETRNVPGTAEVDVSAPFFASEFDTLFELNKRNQGWALFVNPPGFLDQRKRLFTFNIIPSLGSDELYELHAQSIRDKVQKDKEKNKEKKRDKKGNYEDDIELDEEEKESIKLLALLDIIHELDRLLKEVLSKRSQYQKG